MSPKTEKPSSGWSSIRPQLNGWSKSALVALVKDLYDHAADNRDFLEARFQSEDGGGAALEKYRRKILEQFFPRRGMFGKLKLGEARKAIRDYRKATGNLAGTLELMLTYVESGTRFTCEYGDIDEPFYNSLDSVLAELARLLVKEGAELYPCFQERLLQVEAAASNIGWGYCDSVREQVQMLEASLGKEEETGPQNALPKEQP
ncbi:MAG: hypothetical protein EXS18_06700 [Verrucomicrobiae bacterium]|nr:hypothetical protein [Verrucomicrobiae bacterium]